MVVPTISVVIPCFNAAAFLRDTLDSVVSQSHPPSEVLLINDGSTDDSAAIAASYGPRVRVLDQPNQGESTARNRGIDIATSEWIAFIDSDDTWTVDKLEKQVAALSANPDAIAVHTNVRFFGQSDSLMDLTRIPRHELYDVENIAQGSSLHISSLMVRRDRSPAFPTWTRYAEDLIYQLELVQNGPVILVPEYLTGYRKHTASQSNKPAVDIHWHQTIQGWLASPDNRLRPDVRARIASRWLARIVSLAWQAKARRQWDAYWHFREYLQQFRGDPGVDHLLSNRIYPALLYKLLDAIGSRRQS
jgi:glycosyltransferase involved in cell wall biosynthesis